MKIIALEEHLVTANVLAAWRGLDPRWQDLAFRPAQSGDTGRRLIEHGSQRLADMDDAGIDVQVVSFSTPGLQNLPPEDAVGLQVTVNDAIASLVRAHPHRFQGFATLATPAPNQAALELERAVTKLGLNGAMIYGRTRERNADHPDFWPIFEAADALNAPLYLHPQSPPPDVRSAYYSGYGDVLNTGFAMFGIGWHYDAGLQLLRLIVSGVLDRFPNLQLILGHWGEVVLFYLERVEMMGALAKLPRSISEYVRSQVFVTPAGIFSQRYLRWATEVVGIDRIMFAVDYPFHLGAGGAARRFLEEAALSEADRARVAHGNWERLCSKIRR